MPNNGNYAAIRVNLIGREPRGRVARGAEYDAVLAGLRTDLLALENPETGVPLVHEVLRTDDHYDGPLRDWLPDLVVDWNRDAPITDARSAKVGTIRGMTQATRSGDHRPPGLLAVRGPGTVPGRFAPNVKATDLAPTIAAFFGVEMADIDGRPIDALVGPRARAERLRAVMRSNARTPAVCGRRATNRAMPAAHQVPSGSRSPP